MPESQSGGHDHVVAALDGLVDAVEKNAADERQLVRKIEGLREARVNGQRLTDALGEERAPGTMELLGRVLGRLMEASGTARRALARAMRNEGTSIPTIARLFGVTHQRISNILNHPAAAPSVMHEPASGPGPAPATEPANGPAAGSGAAGAPTESEHVPAEVGQRAERS